MNFKKLIDQYDYDLPESFIAQKPATPRDSAKLLIYERDTKKTSLDTFKNLVKYLPKNSVLVFNKTKVIPARILVSKPTGGKISLLYVRTEGNEIIFLANNKVENGTTLSSGIYSFQVREKVGNEYFTIPSFPLKQFSKVLNEIGITPLPPYIKKSPLSEKKLRLEYQTVFAKTDGSVAAPTASLHFTKSLIRKIENAGHEIYFITLHVNLGTFAKLSENNIKTTTLHKEYYEIDKNIAVKLNQAKKENKNIIAVGTTVVRTLEAASKNGKLVKLNGTTDLFITENYKVKFVNSLITNFHVPKSSLLMLVAAFIGRKKLFELYNTARRNNFRFFSFGDGMFLA